MKTKLKKAITMLAAVLPVSFCRFLHKSAAFFARSLQMQIEAESKHPDDIAAYLASQFIRTSYQKYPQESLKEKRFYNVGAGMQRSQYPYWTYIDLISESYQGNQPDIPFDLESLEKLPLLSGRAEIVYNSYLMEHISWLACQNLIREAWRILKRGGGVSLPCALLSIRPFPV